MSVGVLDYITHRPSLSLRTDRYFSPTALPELSLCLFLTPTASKALKRTKKNPTTTVPLHGRKRSSAAALEHFAIPASRTGVERRRAMLQVIYVGVHASRSPERIPAATPRHAPPPQCLNVELPAGRRAFLFVLNFRK